MQNLLKISTRLLAVALVCATLSACGQSTALSSNFPTYAGQSGGGFVPPTIMDY